MPRSGGSGSRWQESKGPPFSLTIKGVGHFPPGRHPRVLWVGMEESRVLPELQQGVELALVGAGLPPEDRGFSPHITIARLRETPADKVAALEERHRLLPPAPSTVAEFYLYSSTSSREMGLFTSGKPHTL